jgi:DNA-binding winged helix-turn-helix (wHTH) protein
MQAVRFGRFEVDLESLELLEYGSPVSLQPQPAQVLAALLARPGRLVSRAELRATVWRDRIIEFDAGLNFSILQESCAPTGRTPGAIGSHT